MKGRLLNHVGSFSWNDKNVDRSFALQNYNKALNKAREFGDQVFCPEKMYDPENKDIIFLFMWLNNYQYDELKAHFEWLKVDDFQVLQNISLGPSTPNSSNNWEDFSNEFQDENKSLIGLKQDDFADPLVYDEETHEKFHANYVATFDFNKQKSLYGYFKTHYKPSLKIEKAQINNFINRDQVHERFVRLDDPPTSPNGEPVHGQQIHIHIKIRDTVCALNIDGTWKHPPKNITEDRIPAEVCSTLSEWGFCLPEDYYE